MKSLSLSIIAALFTAAALWLSTVGEGNFAVSEKIQSRHAVVADIMGETK